MNPAKRRRLDATASTLRKPFRSPLKVAIDDQTSRRPGAKSNLEQQTPAPSPSQASSLNHNSSTERSYTSCSPTKSTSTDNPSCSTGEITILQKRYSALTQELRKLRQDLDTAEQARKICSSRQSEQIDRLTLKWRDIARSAADGVFEITNKRVKDMGGVRAWQKSIQESSQSWLASQTLPQGDCYYSGNGDTMNQYPPTSARTGNGEDEQTDEQQEVRRDGLIDKCPTSNSKVANIQHEHNASPDEYRSQPPWLR